VNLRTATSIEDLRTIAKRRVPHAFFQYADHGSYEQQTLRANREDLEALRLRQRIGIDVGSVDLTTTIAGNPSSLPIALAPIGSCGMQYGDGEILAARAAQAAGIPFCLSTLSICSLEDVDRAVDSPFWFQLYVMRDRGFVREMIARAKAAKVSALMITMDLNRLGQRHCDVKNGLTVPLKATLRNLADVATKPRWLMSVLRGKRKTFGNLDGRIAGMAGVNSLAEWVSMQFDPTLNWNDIAWIRERWNGPIVIKGVLDAEDARKALEAGATAIVVSNHGGRQLDGAPSTISMLPRIAQDVGSNAEVLFDGGIRSGQDVLRALALGARACLLGRAYIYGLGAAGGAGVTRAIRIIRNELETSMALTGTTSVRGVTSDVVMHPA
jgi:L-lactate dehydrogenase (cytochrome)